MSSWSSELHKDQIEPTKTISVWLDNTEEFKKKNFRCCNCGLIVFSYFCDIRIIVVGGRPTIVNPTKVYSHPLEIMCKRCRQMYIVE